MVLRVVVGILINELYKIVGYLVLRRSKVGRKSLDWEGALIFCAFVTAEPMSDL